MSSTHAKMSAAATFTPPDAPRLSIYLPALVAAMGGLLFGFGTAVINGAIVFLKRQFSLSASQTELAASSILSGLRSGRLYRGSVQRPFRPQALADCLRRPLRGLLHRRFRPRHSRSVCRCPSRRRFRHRRRFHGLAAVHRENFPAENPWLPCRSQSTRSRLRNSAGFFRQLRPRWPRHGQLALDVCFCRCAVLPLSLHAPRCPGKSSVADAKRSH
jgi:hypothetical protein